MAVREELVGQELEPAAVRLVLEALTALVLDHVALVVELRLVDAVEQRREAVGLEPEQRLEVARRHGREVVGAVVVGGAVDAALLEVRAELLDEREVLAGHVLRALEHHVLEEVREAGPPRLLVLRADVVPLVDVDDRQLAIDVQDHLQAVGEHVLLEDDLGNRCGGGCHRRGERRNPRQQQSQRRESLHGETGRGGTKSGHSSLLKVDLSINEFLSGRVFELGVEGRVLATRRPVRGRREW